MKTLAFFSLLFIVCAAFAEHAKTQKMFNLLALWSVILFLISATRAARQKN